MVDAVVFEITFYNISGSPLSKNKQKHYHDWIILSTGYANTEQYEFVMWYISDNSPTQFEHGQYKYAQEHFNCDCKL